jgi:cell division protease FtsH
MGPERRSMILTEDEKRATAYHESGHAVVARLLPGTDPVHKVTIVPRGRALGLTWQLPERDRISIYKDQMLSQITILFGGRVAEELFVHRISTGASNDFERATNMARDMVTRYGMSEKMGPMVYGENEGEVFLGRSVTTHKNVSEATMQQVDAEIRRIIDEQYGLAHRLLNENRDKIEVMTDALMEYETLDADQVDDIMEGRPPRPPKTGSSSDASDSPNGGATAENPKAAPSANPA